MNRPNLLTRPTKYGEYPWLNYAAAVLHAARIGENARLGLLLLAAAGLVFSLNLLLPGLTGAQPARPAQAGVWAVFGLLALSGGVLLAEAFWPARLLALHLTEKIGMLARQITEPELLLDRLTHLLHTTLAARQLALWRFDSEDSTFTLHRLAGRPSPRPLTELPFDLPPGRLPGAQAVSALPESALKQGLLATGTEFVLSLNSGGQLVGLVGLQAGRGGLPLNAGTRRWFQLVATQVSIALQNLFLQADVAATRQQLYRSSRRAIDAQGDERRNLATELHDDILGRLTAMALGLRRSRDRLAENPAQVEGWLENLETETQAVNRRLREITQGLHPSVLTDLGLISAVEAYLDSLARRPQSGGARQIVTLTAQGFDQQRLSTPKLERDLYYITRQALDNALKHAHAAQIFVHLRWDEQAVSVTVRDTGRGMGAAPEQLMGQNGHLGLLSMVERALAWQGKLVFHSAPEQGTTVRARLPVGQPSRAPAHLQAHTRYLN